MDGLMRDLRLGARTLRKSPGFTLVALLTLALGIGVNSGMFSVVNSVLLRPLPYPEAERIVSVFETEPRGSGRVPASPTNFLDWQERNRSFSHLAAYRPQSLVLTGRGEPERLQALRVSADFFRVLGVAPVLGRGFAEAEDQPGAADVVVLSHGLWQQRFGGDPDVIGQTVTLHGESYEVIGVMPAGFRSPGPEVGVWAAKAWPEAAREARGAHMVNVVGRLRPGVNLEQAEQEMQSIAARIAAENPNPQEGWGASVVSHREVAVGGVRTALYVLMGAVGFVLLIACGNVANLFLARAAARRKEMAVRSAIGAPRWVLVRQMLAEALLLSLAGAGLGLLLASWAVAGLQAAAPAALPRVQEIAIDGRVVAFTVAVAMLAVLIFSLVPALQASRTDLAQAIRDGRKATGGAIRQRLRNTLVATQVALSLLLLIGAGLMLKSFARLQSVDPGFSAENVLSVHVPLPDVRYDTPEKQTAFFDELLTRVGGLPGVQTAAVVSTLPLAGSMAITGVWKEGQEALPPSEISVANNYSVTPEYFSTMQIPLRRGRPLTADDRAGSPPAVVVNETLARTFFAGGDALGQRIRIGGPESEPVEIVGIVGDTKHSSLGQPAPAQLYRAYAQNPRPNMTLLVRTGRNPERLAGAVRGEVLALDGEQPVGRVATLETLLADSLASARFSLVLLGAFAAVALLLALVGIYGVIAYSVSQRTHEFGIQMALGARPSTVLLGVVGQAVRVAAVGIAVGVAGALLATRVLGSLLYQVSTMDPAVYAQLAVVIWIVAVLASYLPARRASRVDPITALRSE